MNWNEETVNIIYASNDGYAGHLAASLVSLMDSSRQIPHMDVYVLSVGMSAVCRERLEGLARKWGRRLTFAELGDLRERFPYDIDTRGFDISAMGRLFAPAVLPETVKRALYLDCDTIVCGSISGLYETELQGNLVGMVMEPTVYREMKEAIGFGKDEPYFNSGVLLMDLEGWRREGILGELLSYYGRHAGRLFACDQDTINGALRGRILSLPPKYNYFTNYRYFRYRTLCSLCGAYRQVGEAAFKEAKAFPAVIHYMGDERPWIAGNRNHYRRLYEEYLARTPWRGTPKIKGKRLYMLMWWALNKATWVCPAFRLWLSRGFGMKVIDGRKNK